MKCGRVVSSSARGRGRSISKIRCRRPGRGDITITRSARNTASAMLCVTNTMVLPVSSQISWSSRFISSRVKASRAPNGSSIRSSDGIEGQAAHDRGALLHAARELARVFGLETIEADPAQQALDAVPVLCCFQALDLERQLDVPDHGTPRQKVGVLEHHADLRVRPEHRRAIQQHLPGGELVQPGHRPEQGGLAAAGWPEHAYELALADAHRVAVQRVHQPGPGRVVLARALDQELGRPLRAVAAVSQFPPHRSLGRGLPAPPAPGAASPNACAPSRASPEAIRNAVLGQG